MKNITKLVLAFALGFSFGWCTTAYAATQYGGGSLLQVGDVKSSHILNGTILNEDVSGAAAISATKIAAGTPFGLPLLSAGSKVATSTSLQYATSTNKLYVFGGSIEATSTNFGGVAYAWPATAGTNGYNLTTDGAGSLTWATAVPPTLQSNIQSATTTTVGSTPKAVYMMATKNYPISYDTSTLIKWVNGVSGAQSGTITVGSGANEALFVTVATQGGPLTAGTATVDGAAMQLVASYDRGGASLRYDYVFSKVGVAAGSRTISVSGSFGGSTNMTIYAASYFGVNQTTPSDATTTGAVSSISVTTLQDGAWAGYISANSGGAVISCAPTQRSADNNATPSCYSDSGAPVSPAGSISGSYSSGTKTESAMIAFTIVPATAPYYGFDWTSAGTAATSSAYIGFITSNTTKGSLGAVTTAGQLAGFTGLTTGAVYYLSNTLGAISTSAGSVSHKIGVALSDTVLLLSNGF